MKSRLPFSFEVNRVCENEFCRLFDGSVFEQLPDLSVGLLADGRVHDRARLSPAPEVDVDRSRVEVLRQNFDVIWMQVEALLDENAVGNCQIKTSIGVQ